MELSHAKWRMTTMARNAAGFCLSLDHHNVLDAEALAFDGGGKACGAAADDDDVRFQVLAHDFLLARGDASRPSVIAATSALQ